VPDLMPIISDRLGIRTVRINMLPTYPKDLIVLKNTDGLRAGRDKTDRQRRERNTNALYVHFMHAVIELCCVIMRTPWRVHALVCRQIYFCLTSIPVSVSMQF